MTVFVADDDDDVVVKDMTYFLLPNIIICLV